MVTPRDKCERCFTHSKNSLGSRCSTLSFSRTFISSQVVFCVSHTSVVSVPRTARAFSRACVKQATMDEPLSGSRTMKSITSLRETSPYFSSNAGCNSEMPSTARHPCSAASADCGSSCVCMFTSSMRAVFSARSV